MKTPVNRRARHHFDLPFRLAALGVVRQGLLFLTLVLASLTPAIAADVEDADDLLRLGKYEDVIQQAAAEIKGNTREPGWALLKIQAEMTLGRYKDAADTLEAASRRYPLNLPLFLAGLDVRRFNGQANEENTLLVRMERMILDSPYRYSAPESQIAIGRFLLRRKVDPKRILDQCYNAVIKRAPHLVDAYLASAELALSKEDNALAVETLQKAPRKQADQEPRYHYLLALAFSSDDRAQTAASLKKALEINPRHVDSLLLQADGLIDGEAYEDVEKVLQQVLAINPSEPRAHAYRAVLAHLRNDEKAENEAYRKAMEPWPRNPEVDTLIGRKLAQKYRFAEAAAHQRQALDFDATYLPAKIELCQALLRLGDEKVGWMLADEIFATDGYNVAAYNLVNLRDVLAKFRTIEDEGIVVRMDPREAELYGPRVMALLKQAKATLSEKYGIELPKPITVEIFPRKNEFAVRTFGFPGADGLLGVCFGTVITANSPASQGENPSNWESVLWHELCHAVTLTKTRNKMPRWLSEGISVYEEEQRDPAWRPPLSPKFREMILGGELTPPSKLSSAFLSPKTMTHLQFAYYESALAVEFLIETQGYAALKGLLDDLGSGKPIAEALPDRAKMTLDELDRAFVKFAKKKAESIAPDVTWEEPDLPDDAKSEEISTWLKSHPKSFHGHRRLAARLLAEEKWPEAKSALLELKALHPDYIGPENAYVLLAQLYRRLNDPEAEHRELDELAARDGDNSSAYLRLMELDEAAKNWDGLAKNARRLLAVNPLIPAPHQKLAMAADRLGLRDEAIDSYRAFARLNDTDMAETHFRLATLLHQQGKDVEARREVLKSLEEAPRFLESHRLLLELPEAQSNKTNAKQPAAPISGN